MIEHDGCVGCKYDSYNEDCEQCTNCTFNSRDRYTPSENYLDKIKISRLEDRIRQLEKSQTKQAHWIPDEIYSESYFVCSECQNGIETTYDFCPNCGAEMNEEE